MIKIICLSLLIVGTFAGPDADADWENFKINFGKTYETEFEETIRQKVYMANWEFIKKHNEEYENGMHSFDVGINEYADMTNDEFVAVMNGLKNERPVDGEMYYEANMNMPKSVDWRKKGYVTAVKNQKQCGSCWAFSATGALEGQHFKKTGKLVSLSEQNLVDCDKHYEECCNGCFGGLPWKGFDFVKKEGGIDTEESYPYKAKNGQCKFNKQNIGATADGYKAIPKHNEHALTNAIASEGPISVGIDASHSSFQFYKHGVYYEKKCSTESLDHGVLAVGYGTLSGKDYYIVKNSWGTSWGQKGYIFMSRNKNNNCGIATAATVPIV